VVMATMVTRTVKRGITAEERRGEGRELTMGIILVLEADGGGRDRIEMTAEIDREDIATSFSTPSESDDDQDEETDASTDDYGVDSASSSALTSALRHPVDSHFR